MGFREGNATVVRRSWFEGGIGTVRLHINQLPILIRVLILLWGVASVSEGPVNVEVLLRVNALTIDGTDVLA